MTEAAACDAFDNRVWAQTVFDTDPGGNAALDPDGDGLACDNLGSGAVPALWMDAVPANAVPVELAEVTDGDTIEVVADGAREPVRLIGVDAPEASGPYQDLECFGPESSGFLAGLLGREGRLYIEKDREERDPYGRLLRWVWLDAGEGEVYLVNEALVRAGYAERYRDTPNRRYVDEIMDAETFAERHGLGLWRACDDRGDPS
jgi:endonuclease YncB( thermonuclease family)